MICKMQYALSTKLIINYNLVLSRDISKCANYTFVIVCNRWRPPHAIKLFKFVIFFSVHSQLKVKSWALYFELIFRFIFHRFEIIYRYLSNVKLIFCILNHYKKTTRFQVYYWNIKLNLYTTSSTECRIEMLFWYYQTIRWKYFCIGCFTCFPYIINEFREGNVAPYKKKTTNFILHACRSMQSLINAWEVVF